MLSRRLNILFPCSKRKRAILPDIFFINKNFVLKYKFAEENQKNKSPNKE
jgi:hypothetical protein